MSSITQTPPQPATEARSASDDEALLRALLDYQPDLICRFNADTTLTYVNQSYAEAFGQAPETLLGRSFLELVPEHHHDEIRARLSRLTPGQPSQTYEHEAIGADGAPIWQEWTDRAFFDDSGQLLTIQSIGRDITERRRAQQELERQTRLQEMLSELSATFINLPLAQVDATIEHSIQRLGRFIGADRFFIFSYDYASGRGRNTFEWVSDGTQPLVEGLVDFPLEWLGRWPEQHRQGQVVHIPDVEALPDDDPDHRLLSPYGIRSSLAVPMMDNDRCIGALGLDSIQQRHFFSDAERRLLVVFAQMLVNIEKRRASLHEIEENRRFLADLIDTSLAIIAVKDTQGRYTLINRQWERTTGRDRLEVLGRTDLEIFDPDTARQFMDNDSEVLEHGRTIRIEETLPGEHDLRYFDAAKFPVRNHGGQVVGLCAMITETTDRRRAESEKIAREAAEAADRAKSAFLSSMSHEMRTPLNAIIGFAQLLLRDQHLGGHQAQQLQTINRSAEHLLSLINDVLDFSKLESSRDHLHEQDFSLRGLIGDIELMFRLRAENLGLYLQSVVNEDVSDELHGDSGKLRQVLINLVGNALKFTREGGVSIKVAQAPAAHDDHESQVPRLRFEVLDTGPGVAPDQQERIFESFHQSEAGRNAGGTGLGLSISRRLVELLGGEMSVISQPGRGACFWFELPLKPGQTVPQSPRAGTRVTGIAHPLEPVRVLAVDDHADNLALFRDLLEPIGFQVCLADSGAAALAECQRQMPDVVLMDLRMPGLDGYATTRRLRELPGGPDLPVVAVTASALAEERQSLAEAGLDAYLRKPFRLEDLLDTLAEQLPLRYRHESAGDSPPVELAHPAPLPPALRAPLAAAVRAGDMAEVANQIEVIRAHDAPAATRIEALAARFEYQALLDLLASDGKTGD